MKIVIFAALLSLSNGQARFDSLRRRASRVQDPTPKLSEDNKIQSFIPQVTRVISRRRTRFEEEDLIEQEWTTFKEQFNKVYSTEEEARRRREIFIENRDNINRHNRGYGTLSYGKTSFFLKVNSFADLLTHEFSTLLNGYGGIARDPADIPTGSFFFKPANMPVLPKNVDWRQKGAVTSVKKQACNGCYAFSAAAAIEGHHYRKTGVLHNLSPQNLIDCTNKKVFKNLGCGGGYVDESFKYVEYNPGINKESVYPHEREAGECRFDPSDVGANVTGYFKIRAGDEEELAIAVATQGPVSVAIDSSLATFKHYSAGIYFDPNCKNKAAELDHAVLVVGYGEEPDNRKYWLVKNSYGTDWGLGGYIKMAKDENNHCGIASAAFFPRV